ncbi:UDP-N-acetylmuramate: L-alanyl-gamma-D-glutamyl-meso-diaminopimelate ligase [Sinomicrobium oceani]|uniref:UDP-N-acetylmuramate: L-alanyl-gamma-D-glutamyl-meso-diaminopimelate ligase n=1 Tax=Sinomicrobium oceani TaxID=1150368 RepID=A0A1K1RS37_9FLAO|nr:hypothetical protein [Sinomicrobium oceani]SFW75107.1 UDP-N-acetylmuramate: L-alanyl-gamma-D-glutamyl-meso-diaminopimelate ligase [Sinomicrobium oceani]
MRIHCIGIGEDRLYTLARALRKDGHVISGSGEKVAADRRLEMEENGWYAGQITADIEAVITGAEISSDNLLLQAATDMGISTYTIPEFLYEFSRYKTRVVAGGLPDSAYIVSVILHILEYHNRPTDYLVSGDSGDMASLTGENDFILLTGSHRPSSIQDATPEFHWYKPNIALLTGISGGSEAESDYKIFVDSIVKGGIIVYNEEDEVLKTIVEASENPIRKHPYRQPEYERDGDDFVLETSEGPMPVALPDTEVVRHLIGAQWICQHMGIDEDDFYEALAAYEHKG